MVVIGNLRVTPETLLSTSVQLAQSNASVQKLTQQMMDIVNELSNTWTGEVAQAYYNKLKGLEPDTQKLIRITEEYADGLQSMAKAYQDAEKFNQHMAGVLSTKGIV